MDESWLIQLETLQRENEQLRTDLITAFERIRGASEVLGRAAERALLYDGARRSELLAVKTECDMFLRTRGVQ